MFAALALSLAVFFGAGTAPQASVDADALAKVDVFEVTGLIDCVVASGIERAV